MPLTNCLGETSVLVPVVVDLSLSTKSRVGCFAQSRQKWGLVALQRERLPEIAPKKKVGARSWPWPFLIPLSSFHGSAIPPGPSTGKLLHGGRGKDAVKAGAGVGNTTSPADGHCRAARPSANSRRRKEQAGDAVAAELRRQDTIADPVARAAADNNNNNNKRRAGWGARSQPRPGSRSWTCCGQRRPGSCPSTQPHLRQVREPREPRRR